MARRVIIFIDQRFEILERAIGFRPRHGRRQMINDDRARPPLGLRSLAWIIDDERIHMRHRAEHRLGETVRRQRQRLAGEPFEIAVLAHVNHSIAQHSDVRIKGEIAMRRHKVRRVIGLFRIDIVAARRLDADQRPAEA